MAIPEAFLNPVTIGTFTGATAGVVAVAVLFRKVFNTNWLGIPAITSYLITGVLAYTDESLETGLGIVIAILNGAMLFCASVGMNESVSAIPPRSSTSAQEPGSSTSAKEQTPSKSADKPNNKRMKLFKSYFRSTE
jgi:hypothetical protein